MQSLVPKFLELSLNSFSKDQEKFRKQLTHTFGTGAFDMIEDQVRKNSELFQKAFNMFVPTGTTSESSGTNSKPSKEKSQDSELSGLQKQINELQQKIDKMASK